MTAYFAAKPGETFAFTGSEDAFEILYGIPVATLGEGESPWPGDTSPTGASLPSPPPTTGECGATVCRTAEIWTTFCPPAPSTGGSSPSAATAPTATAGSTRRQPPTSATRSGSPSSMSNGSRERTPASSPNAPAAESPAVASGDSSPPSHTAPRAGQSPATTGATAGCTARHRAASHPCKPPEAGRIGSPQPNRRATRSVGLG